ncbi:MAG: hypothetical protein M1482_12685, partial [Chloroflexi bacterium]|nr:hypothetical protein [Chloroflexota bacterium]
MIGMLRRRPALTDALAMLCLAALPFVYFWQVTLGARVFDNGDISSVFLPFRLELERALAQGQLPLWTTHLHAGFPLFAEGQVAALYPPNLLLYRLLPIPQALSYTILVHVAWAAVGIYLLARLNGAGAAGGFLAGIALSFSGFFLAHLQHLALLSAAAWLPWMLYLQGRYWRAESTPNSHSRFWFVLSSLAIGIQFLCGSPHMEFLNVLAFCAFGLFSPLVWFDDQVTNIGDLAHRTFKRLAKTALTTCAAIAAGALVAAAQLIPTAELLANSVRPASSGDGFSTSYSLTPAALVQFIAPFAWSGPPTVLNQEYWGYFGLVPLMLALAAPFLKRSVSTTFLAVFSIVSLSLTLGSLNPLYGILDAMPVVNGFRVPARFLYLFLVGAAILAGVGVDELLKRLGRLRVSPAAALWASAGLVVLLWTGTALDLASFSRPFLASLDSTTTPAELMQAPISVEALASGAAPYRIFTNIYNETFRPNHPLIYDIDEAQNYSPLELARNDAYLADLSPAMVDLMNIRYFIQPSGPLPAEFAQPTASVVLDLFQGPLELAPTVTSRVVITSYLDNPGSLPAGFAAGDLVLTGNDGASFALPIRAGIETGDWAGEVDDASSAMSNPSAARVVSFPAYLLS